MGRTGVPIRERRPLAALREADRSEVLFVAAIIGLGVVVGIVQPDNGLAVHILLVLWAGLVGMMIPRMKTARAKARGVEYDVDHPTVRHDIAAALLMIEGGVTAMRYLDRKDQSAQLESIAHAIETEIRRIRRLSSSARTDGPCTSVAETIFPLIDLHVANGARITTRLHNAPPVVIPPDDLARIFANLFDNCARHAPGAQITIEGARHENNYAVTIRDNGPGIDAGIRASVSDQGVSTRPSGGIGLYSVRSMVESAGGKFTITSAERGTLVRLTLRIAARQSSAAEMPAVELLPPAGAA